MFRPFISLLLALLVLVSSTGYSITAHLCRGKAVSYSLFGRPAGCGMKEDSKAKDHCTYAPKTAAAGPVFQKPGCCANASQHFSGIEPAAKLTEQPLSPAFFLAVVLPIWPDLMPGVFTSALKPPFANYSPPDLLRDLPVLLRVFRI